MTGPPPDAPSSFVRQSLAEVRPLLPETPRALDVAAGTGRHTTCLAEMGMRAFGVDRDLGRLRQARAAVSRAGGRAGFWVADLEASGWPVRGRFDVVLCTRYLWRPLWPALRDAVAPGGFVVYETFTTHQRRHGWGPSSPEFLLRPGELAEAFSGWQVWRSEEVEAPVAEARLLARRPE